MNYRESISKNGDIRYVHKKQSGGSGQFADVAIRFQPGEPGSGFVFKSEIKGGAVPKEYIPGALGAVVCVLCLRLVLLRVQMLRFRSHYSVQPWLVGSGLQAVETHG